MKRWIAAGSMSVFLGLAACGSSSPVVGKWGTGLDDCTPDRAIEFTSDGRVTQVGRDIGTWVADGNDVAVNRGGQTTRGTVSGNRLALGSVGYDRCGR